MATNEEIIAFCRDKSLSIACAESCTGGLVANTLTDVPGASTCFLGGIVAYSAKVKISRLGVPAQTIEKFGVVSEECAKAMAEGARKVFGADFAVSTTGVAGPGAQNGIKAGTVCVAVATPNKTQTSIFFFDEEPRERVKFLATEATLSMLLRALREQA